MTVEDAAGSLSLALRVSQPLVLQARHSQCSQCEPPCMSAEPVVCLSLLSSCLCDRRPSALGRLCVGASIVLPCITIHAHACFMTQHAQPQCLCDFGKGTIKETCSMRQDSDVVIVMDARGRPRVLGRGASGQARPRRAQTAAACGRVASWSGATYGSCKQHGPRSVHAAGSSGKASSWTRGLNNLGATKCGCIATHGTMKSITLAGAAGEVAGSAGRGQGAARGDRGARERGRAAPVQAGGGHAEGLAAPIYSQLLWGQARPPPLHARQRGAQGAELVSSMRRCCALHANGMSMACAWSSLLLGPLLHPLPCAVCPFPWQAPHMPLTS